MIKEIYFSNKSIRYYVNYIDNTAVIESFILNYYKWIGYVIIDILNDFYDMIYDNIIEDSGRICIFINNKSKNEEIIDFNIYDYINKYDNIDIINNKIFNNIKLNNNSNYLIIIRYKNFEDLIIY